MLVLRSRGDTSKSHPPSPAASAKLEVMKAAFRKTCGNWHRNTYKLVWRERGNCGCLNRINTPYQHRINTVSTLYQHWYCRLDRAPRASESRPSAGRVRGRRLSDPVATHSRADGQAHMELTPEGVQARPQAAQRQRRLLQRHERSQPLTTAAAARQAAAQAYFRSHEM